MKVIKHIRQDFHSAAWVMTQGWDLGVPWGGGGGGGGGGGAGGFIFFPEIQPELVCELLTCIAHAKEQFLGLRPPGALGGANRSNIIKSQLLSRFQRFLNQELVCDLLTRMAHATAEFFGSPAPWGGAKGQIS